MYAFIDSKRGIYSVRMIARLLEISSHYDDKRGVHPIREQNRETMERLIQQVYAAIRGQRGASRRATEIQAGHFHVSVHTVSK